MLKSYQFYNSTLIEFDYETFEHSLSNDSKNDAINANSTDSTLKGIDNEHIDSTSKNNILNNDDLKDEQSKIIRSIKFIATFSNSYILTTLILDNIDTSKLVSIRSMCSNCINLKYVSMKNWNVQRLVNCDFAFSNCSKLLIIEINWKNINNNINCYMTLRKCPAIVISDNFKFNINNTTPMTLF